MPDVKNVQLEINPVNNSSRWIVNVKGIVDFDQSETGNYELQIFLYAADADESIFPILNTVPDTSRLPIYMFRFVGPNSIALPGKPPGRIIQATPGASLEIDASEFVSNATLDEDPGKELVSTPIGIRNLERPDEILAEIRVSSIPAKGLSNIEKINETIFNSRI
ncbi:MAG: hypothetical protein AAGA83_08640 [Cyanobacteria bacterium P01_F01_bin.116]